MASRNKAHTHADVTVNVLAATTDILMVLCVYVNVAEVYFMSPHTLGILTQKQHGDAGK